MRLFLLTGELSELSEGCAAVQHRYHRYSESTELLGPRAAAFWPPQCSSLAAPPNICFSEMEPFACSQGLDVVGGGLRGSCGPGVPGPGPVLASVPVLDMYDSISLTR